jgi:hypothetical protein
MPGQRTQFLICESCFWCASILEGGRPVGRCPRCKSSMLEFIPIATGESYRLDYGAKSGVTVKFVATG